MLAINPQGAEAENQFILEIHASRIEGSLFASHACRHRFGYIQPSEGDVL